LFNDAFTGLRGVPFAGVRFPRVGLFLFARDERGALIEVRYRYRDGSGEIGLISSVTQPFCHDCTRARLSAEGKLYTCLFALDGADLRGPLRDGASDADLQAAIRAVWRVRADRYSELRSEATANRPRIEMFAIGG